MHYSISMSSTFPIELWHLCQWACDCIPRTDDCVEGFPSATQSSVTNMHLSVWKMGISLKIKKVKEGLKKQDNKT